MNLNPNLPPHQSGNHQPRKSNILFAIFGWIFGVFFLLVALASLFSQPHFLISFVFGLLGLLLLPPGHRFIERKLKFRLKVGHRIISVIALISIAAILIGSYSDADKRAEEHSRLNTIQEQRRKDNLNIAIQACIRLVKEHKLDEASNQLHNAYAFTATRADTALIVKESTNILATKIADLIHTGLYDVAIPKLDTLIAQNAESADLFYNRAICYSKKGKTQEAVNDCKSAMQLGSKNAEVLYDKINPSMKRIAYYINRCCDGTTSTSTGKGTCSHHGGVCEWNQPVYEYYRKYE